MLAQVADVGDRRLGKGVVVAQDTPNFIGNHIGLYAIARILDVWAEGRFTIEEIDAMTGPAIGRPKSATFRTLDITGLDVLIHVARNLESRVGPEQARAFAPPALALAVAERGWIGEKAGQGFYRREKGPGGQSAILTLDPATMTYRPQQKARFASIDRARTIEDVGARVRALFLGDDPVGDFLRRTLGATLLYTASVAPDIAHSLDDVDRAMRWGYGWELGPFEIADAIGLRTLVDACPASYRPARTGAAARRRPARRRRRHVPRGPARACPVRRAALRRRQGADARRGGQPRRQPGRSRRRRPRRSSCTRR